MEIKFTVTGEKWLDKIFAKMYVGGRYQIRRNKGVSLKTQHETRHVFGYKIDEASNKCITTLHFITIISDIFSCEETITYDNGRTYVRRFEYVQVFLDDDTSTTYNMHITDVQFLKIV